MNFTYHTDREFFNVDFTESFEKGEYDNCTFINCNLEGTVLSGSRLINCSFQECNLSNAKIEETSFQHVSFNNCKMIGMAFEDSSEFGFNIQIDHSQLEHASFYRVKFNKSIITNSQLHFTDFTEANLDSSIITNCDLNGATFYQTNLQKVDLRNSENYEIDPESNRIKGAKFSLPEVTGLLSKYQIIIE